MSLAETIANIERDFGGTLGVAVSTLPAHELVFNYREHDPFPAASTIKVFILQALLEHVQAGALTLDDEIKITADDIVTGSGVIKTLTPRRYPVKDLATLMIVVSDNTATNLLIDVLTTEHINAVCQEHDWQDTQLTGKLQRGNAPSHTSPHDLTDYFTRLWQGSLLNEELTEVARAIYWQQQYTDQLGRLIGFDPYSTEIGESSLRIASKSGAIRGVRNDAGVITDSDISYAISVMTKDSSDLRFHVNNAGSLAIAAVSRAVFEHLKGQHGAR